VKRARRDSARDAASGQQTPEFSRCSLAARSLLGCSWFALWFFIVFPGGLLQLAGEGLVPPPGANRPIGWMLIAAAHVLLIALVARFVRQGSGTPVPIQPPTQIVSQGLYARVRNPMYATYVAIAFAEAILYRSWILLAYAAGLALLVHAYVVLVEEPKLCARFGAAYERYCETSGRWLPRR
jgi:protein-S-isoprenylcysteine O-methyltransferase Ste14